MTSETRFFVFAYLGGRPRAVPAADISLVEEKARVVSCSLGYGKRYLARPEAIAIDPLLLPVSGAQSGDRHKYEPPPGQPLFGAIRDAAPEGWARRVIESRSRARPGSLPESVYLLGAGSNRFGALDLRPEVESEEAPGRIVAAAELRQILDGAERIERGEPVPTSMEAIFEASTAMGGARPKALVARNGRQYLAKFGAAGDAFDVPAIERATLEMARACGISVPSTDLLRLADGRSILLSERFDRRSLSMTYGRIPAVSARTLLGDPDPDSTGASYAAISLALSRFGASGGVVEDRNELFARMVFNILVGNDGDHLANHSFLWDAQAKGWRLAPLYDVVPNPALGSERYQALGVGPQGRLASLENALVAAPQFGLHRGKARPIIERVWTVVREWRTVFQQWGVSAAECEKVAPAFLAVSALP